jgi:hypothetical protein
MSRRKLTFPVSVSEGRSKSHSSRSPSVDMQQEFSRGSSLYNGQLDTGRAPAPRNRLQKSQLQVPLRLYNETYNSTSTFVPSGSAVNLADVRQPVLSHKPSSLYLSPRSPTGTSRDRSAAVFHVPPAKPLLVLFARTVPEKLPAIAAVPIDDFTRPNPTKCLCEQDPEDCEITALERRGGSEFLDIRRITPKTGQWDILPFSLGRQGDLMRLADPAWKGIRRISIMFLTPTARREFGGTFCLCKIRTVQEEQNCARQGHIGIFGLVRVMYRREAQRWSERYDQQTQVRE